MGYRKKGCSWIEETKLNIETLENVEELLPSFKIFIEGQIYQAKTEKQENYFNKIYDQISEHEYNKNWEGIRKIMQYFNVKKTQKKYQSLDGHEQNRIDMTDLSNKEEHYRTKKYIYYRDKTQEKQQPQQATTQEIMKHYWMVRRAKERKYHKNKAKHLTEGFNFDSKTEL